MIDVLGSLLVPSGWIAVLIALSFVLFPFSRLRRFARRALTVSALVYGVFGLGPVAYALLAPLERAHPPLTDLSVLRDVDTIVVLTGYASRNAEMPPTDQLNASSTYRLIHAIWMITKQQKPKMLISGSAESAAVMRDVAIALGVPSERVLLDHDATDTGDSAEQMQRRMHGKRCALVTSAGHMPRAMGAFRLQGVECIPAPIEFYTTYPLDFFDFFPNPRNLTLSDLAVHEHLALAWYRLQGRL